MAIRGRQSASTATLWAGKQSLHAHFRKTALVSPSLLYPIIRSLDKYYPLAGPSTSLRYAQGERTTTARAERSCDSSGVEACEKTDSHQQESV
jgi:hypothetical protein